MTAETDLISRQAAIDAIWDGINMDIYTREVKECLEALPSVTPQPMVGKWNSRFTEIKGNNTFNCMECGSTFIVEQGSHNMNYCPNCGAKMETKEP